MKKIIAQLEQLLKQNKGKTIHLPSLRPNCHIHVIDTGTLTIDLSLKTVSEGAIGEPGCTIEFPSLAVLEEVMSTPANAWTYSGRGGKIKVSDRLSAAILLESLYPGTLAATLKPRQFYSLFPHLVPNEYAGHTTEQFFNTIIPKKLAEHPDILSTVRAAFQFNIEGAGTWTIDVTTPVAQVYAGPAKTKGSIIATDRKTFEEVLNDDSKAWNYFNSGLATVSNACRASQIINAIWPTAFAKGMPSSLYASLFPNEMGDPSAPEYNKTTGDYVTYVYGKDKSAVPIYYSLLGDLAIYQGDIILGLATDMEHVRRHIEEKAMLPESVRIIDWGNPAKFLWPKGVVFYNKDSSLTNEAGKELQKAMDYWSAQTAITFKQRTAETNYVVIKDSTGCSSNVGMIGGKQEINLNKNCDFGAVVHEIGHTVGLFHEQCRVDRDKHVTIQWTNIEAGHEHNFVKQSPLIAEDLGAYDFGSIMHYSATAFSKNKEATILTIPPNQAIGQRSGLSAGDLAGIVSMYGAKKAEAARELTYHEA